MMRIRTFCSDTTSSKNVRRQAVDNAKILVRMPTICIGPNVEDFYRQQALTTTLFSELPPIQLFSSKMQVRLRLVHGSEKTLLNRPTSSVTAPIRRSATTTQGSPPYCSTDFINSYSNGSHDNKTEDQRLANGPYSERAEKKSTGRFLGKDSAETQTTSRKNNNNNGIKPLNTKVSSPLPRERERDAVSSESNPRPTNKDLSKDFDRGEGTVLPPAGQKVNQANYSNFRPMNSRNNNFLGGQQISPLPSQQRGSANQQSANNYTLPGRDSEDLVAMGTSPLYGRGRLKEGINGSGMYYAQSSTATLGSVRKLHKSNGFSRSKESEPKYADPFSNGPPTFNQRLAEIASLEQETIRYERTKKFKKKKSEAT